MLNKLIYSFFISIVIGITSSILSLTINVKTINSVFIGIIISNMILIGVYIPDIIEGYNNADLAYIIGYSIICMLFYLFYIPFIIVTNNKNCYIKCCKNNDYEPLERMYDGT